ncbi:glycine--tRNA ligase subunit beta [Sulfitobacter sp. KE29]|uniref:glycine--tRNA ligase subunit beta n=1 Tax=unclassified Sulfitobacter TaxID=196795 RepID=UPI0007C288A8|nr:MULTISPECIES: glycine--tRNA ligase subunit beta [unclassified Sulfitobacter]MBO9438813.1 glycine--tRNA ligase subunit beta [Sulfitobacter sp. R18_2]KZY52986.1 glycine--tRNA ligase subunit beta [Sulfitobacter sp. HI0054]MDF3418021.1 glycine--tRNA ligase subunit beta [Sulfitobacter sp. Ks38]MDF3425503.1 glycine--tRNA ligase subunit beta [Sulfitobacter sp. KE29]MDF3429084.1 glycine--tRNA ligase subunit beta [Sulfitobacter sp. S46]
MPDLLIELFSEEIPARMQKRAGEDLQKLVTNGLVEAGLTYGSAAVFTTPRRLTLALGDMLAASPRQVEERKGPKADAPEKAVEGFLRGAGLTRDQLEERDTPKGKVLFAKIEKPGRPAAEIVAEVLEQTIRNFPWPKSMRWGSGSLKWVRPLHSILCVISDEAGAEVVPLTIDGITAGNTTRGHRFLAPDEIEVAGFEDYQDKLSRAFVVLDPATRADTIWHDATNMAFAAGLEVVEDAGLLAEVAGLVEYPVVLMGRIGEDFLGLPPEVLQTSMKEHQKFFSVRNPKSGQIERFVTVANRTTADEGATILAGNEKVLGARLSDAKFFWDNDLRSVTTGAGMETWVKALENVTFHNKLGTQAELIDRMATLSRELAPLVGADADEAEKAARVAKADLSSEMVYEFPELQGLMGSYYARRAGMSDAVADAAKDHYAPLGPSDDVPTAPVSIAVALAEKIDKLTGFWAIDEKPTGSKDPFALRRAALGVIRILVENDVSLSLNDVLGQSAEIVGDRDAGRADTADILGFIHDRLKVYLRDQGIRHDVIDACIAMDGSDDLTLLVKRARALSETLKTDDGENLIQGFKRANNILSQAEEADGVEYSFGADPKFAETEAEKDLFAALDKAEAKITPAMAAQDFSTAMAAMAELRGPIDAFFEAVQVNAENPTVRRNRLNLLSRIRTICSAVADLTKLDG